MADNITTWRTSDRGEVPIAELSDSHLAYAIAWTRKRIKKGGLGNVATTRLDKVLTALKKEQRKREAPSDQA